MSVQAAVSPAERLAARRVEQGLPARPPVDGPEWAKTVRILALAESMKARAGSDRSVG